MRSRTSPPHSTCPCTFQRLRSLCLFQPIYRLRSPRKLFIINSENKRLKGGNVAVCDRSGKVTDELEPLSRDEYCRLSRGNALSDITPAQYMSLYVLVLLIGLLVSADILAQVTPKTVYHHYLRTNLQRGYRRCVGPLRKGDGRAGASVARRVLPVQPR